ncbi:MAG: chemotaxis protein CheW [Anaerolineae bacterium]|jgi:two-component system chemotaxis sensor kinase CheA
MTLSFDISPDELDAFLQDTDDQIALLNESIVRLEKESHDGELLQAVFRAAHTLKGSAGLIRHERMAKLTHALETVLDRVRKGTLDITPELVDVMLTCIDLITALKEEVAGGVESGVDVDATVEWLQRLLGDEASAAHEAKGELDLTLDDEIRAILRADRSLAPHYIRVTVDDASIAVGARLYQVLLEAEAYGRMARSAPTMDDINAGIEAQSVEILLLTEHDADTIRLALRDISEVTQVEITPLKTKFEDDEPDQVTGESSGTGDETSVARPLPGKRPDAGATEVKLDTRVRIGIDQLDRLMNLTGELVVSRTHLMQIEAELSKSENGHEIHTDQLGEVTIQMSRIIDQLAEEVMRARMVPVGPLFAKFPRLVRDLTRSLGKEVDLVIEGQDTELDRSVIEAIGDPLIHLLRNSVDHGIELPDDRRRVGKPPRGRVHLAAQQREGHIHITVSDDGRGIDPVRLRQSAVAKGFISDEAAASMSDEEAVELIFLSGASTAREVTDISGRGVGMDIVRANIERLNGAIEVHSDVGRGTTFELTLPLTMAIVPSMLISLSGGVYAVPLSSVVDVQRLYPEEIRTIEGKEATVLHGQVLPLLRLHHVLCLDDRGRARRRSEQLVVVRAGRMQAGLIVDHLIGNQEVVIKPLGPLVSGVPGLAGGSILGNGRIALVLDVPEVLRIAMRQRDHIA